MIALAYVRHVSRRVRPVTVSLWLRALQENSYIFGIHKLAHPSKSVYVILTKQQYTFIYAPHAVSPMIGICRRMAPEPNIKA